MVNRSCKATLGVIVSRLILKPDDCELFFASRAVIATFMQREFGIEGQLFSDDPLSPDIDEALFREVLGEFYAQPDLVGKVLKSAPRGTSTDLAKAVRDWRYALSMPFITFMHEGRVVFYSDGYLFEVMGLSKPVSSMVDVPADGFLVLRTALVPCGDDIAYDGFLVMHDIGLGDGITSMFRKEVDAALSDGRWVRTAEELREVAPKIRKASQDRKAQQFAEEIEDFEKSQVPQDGTHRGALANLSREEREKRVDEEMRSLYGGRSGLLNKVLGFNFITRPLCDTLPDLLAISNKASLADLARLFDVYVPSGAKKAAYVEALAAAIPTRTEFLITELDCMSPQTIALLRDIMAAGGILKFERDQLPLVPIDLFDISLCYAFEHECTVSYVVPVELREFVSSLDLGAMEKRALKIKEIAHTADALASLRGIVPAGDVYDEFIRLYHEQMDRDEFDQLLFYVIQGDCREAYLFDAHGTEYVLHEALAADWCDVSGVSLDLLEGGFLEGDLGFLKRILESQKGKEPRPLGPGLLTGDDVFDLRATTPASLALRDYLDANVPDGQDDYFFADKVIDELIDYFAVGMHGTECFNVFLEILEDNGYVPDKAHLTHLMELATNMINSMPTQANNGWSPHELMSRTAASTGRRVFYNDDGTVKRVGRNDPCPCGSGKKYKKCCGRGGR